MFRCVFQICNTTLEQHLSPEQDHDSDSDHGGILFRRLLASSTAYLRPDGFRNLALASKKDRPLSRRASEACRDSDPRGAGQCKHRTATGRSHPPGTGHLKAGRFLDTACSPTIGQQHRETQGRELAVKRFLVTCRHVPNWSYMTCMLIEGRYTQSDHPEVYIPYINVLFRLRT